VGLPLPPRSPKDCHTMSAGRPDISYDDILSVLPRLDREQQLRLRDVLSSLLETTKTHEVKRRRHLLELEGLGAEIWAGLGASSYLNGERDSWE